MNARLPVEPWCVREPALDLEHLGQMESLFALSNGHLGFRGNLDEGEPSVIPGTYLGGFYEERPLPYAEAGYGYPESGQTVVNVTNGKLIRLLVDDAPFDVRYGHLVSHERWLDLRAGTLERKVEWRSPSGAGVRIRTSRLVSFTERAAAAIAYEVQAIEQPVRVVVQSQLVANEAPPHVIDRDPRVAAALERPLLAVGEDVSEAGTLLLHRTRSSGLLIAAGMDHVVRGPDGFALENDAHPDWAGVTVVCSLPPGERLHVVKYLAYAWSEQGSVAVVRDQVAATLAAARHAGWGGLAGAQRRYLDEFWERADVEIGGDPALQQGVRFALFHLLQASARAEGQGIAAKGLTGPGYDGHAFWDTEGFVLPVLMRLIPRAAADALRWRACALPSAEQRARALGLDGAAFPWRTINGAESAPYWPAGTAAFHVNAVIAGAFDDYREVTGDGDLEEECGLEVLVATARLWSSIGHYDRHGHWHVDGVTGPDEYTAVVNDNVFTNLMSARNLAAAADACARHLELARDLGVTIEESAGWRAAAASVHIPFDDELQVHPQCELFTRLEEWDFADGRYPLMLYAPYFQLYRKQVVKQPDLVLAMQWCREAFTPEQKARNFDYYERRTVRDSSLSAGSQSVVSAEIGHLPLALDYLREAAFMDLHDLHGNTTSGIHLGCLASVWTAVVEGFGGLCRNGGALHLRPALPDCFTHLRFQMRWRDSVLKVEIRDSTVRCSLPEDDRRRLTLWVYGEPLELSGGEPIERALQKHAPSLAVPSQPPGRRPLSSLLNRPAAEQQPAPQRPSTVAANYESVEEVVARTRRQ